jgi:arylformamidase
MVSSSTAELYRGMDRAALDAAYNNSKAVANSAAIVAEWEQRSAALRASHPHSQLDMRYGGAERNRIDLLEARPGAPLLVFIHGGYWQMRAKETFTFIAAGPLARGISVALVGYTLAPEKRLDEIVTEVSAALDFLAAGRSGLYVSGWSAGGHLTAMAIGHPAVRGGVAISGLYDLEPIRLSYLNEKLRLDEPEALRNSPLHRLAEGGAKPLVVAYGTAELAELQRQSQVFVAAREHAGLPTRQLPLAGHDHFTILEELASPQGALTGALRTLLDA